eukprot:g15985.t1
MGGMSSLLFLRFNNTNLTGGPGQNESVSRWINRLQKELAEDAAEEKRLLDEAKHVELQVRVAEALRLKDEASAKADVERRTLEEAGRKQEAARQQQALHTPIGRWLMMDANFSDAQATRFCAGLEKLGLSSIQALRVQKETEQEQLALELKMNRFETTMFTNALEALRSKPAATGVSSSTVNAGASFVNLMQLRDGGGMATVFTANQLLDGPDSSSTRPVVLKRSDKDHPASHKRESRILQYLSRPGGVAQAFAIQLIEAYSTPEYNFIAMEQGGQNLLTLVEESKALPLSEQRKTKLSAWGQRVCQDVWSLGMVLYFLATEGSPYFPTPPEKTETAIAQFREETRHALSDTNFRVDLKDVLGKSWRCSLRLALITREDERGTASEVLEGFSRGMLGLVSTVSKTRGMEYIAQKLAVISENQQEVLRRTGTTAGNLDRVLQEQLDLRLRVVAMSTVLEHLAMEEMRMPHTFLEWMKKHATLLQVTVMAIVAAAAVADATVSGGTLGRVATSMSLPFEVGTLDDAYSFLSDAGGEEMDHILDNISDALSPTKGEVGVPTNVRGVKEVTGAEYRSVLHYLDTECQGWDQQMGGMERALSTDACSELSEITHR